MNRKAQRQLSDRLKGQQTEIKVAKTVGGIAIPRTEKKETKPQPGLMPQWNEMKKVIHPEPVKAAPVEKAETPVFKSEPSMPGFKAF
jgi:hypothetical protein